MARKQKTPPQRGIATDAATSATSSASDATPIPTPSQLAEVDRWDERRKARPRLPRLKIAKVDKSGNTSLAPDHPHDLVWAARICETFGTTEQQLASRHLEQLVNGTLVAKEKPQPGIESHNAAIAAIAAIGPRDEIESMLAVQMVATHNAAMAFMSRMLQAETLPHVDSAGNLVAKLLRSYAAQTEALAKYRRRGAQTVRVEHIHVHPGAQAIVGNVAPGGWGAAEK